LGGLGSSDRAAVEDFEGRGLKKVARREKLVLLQGGAEGIRCHCLLWVTNCGEEPGREELVLPRKKV